MDHRRVTLKGSDATPAAEHGVKSRSCFLHVEKSGGSSVIASLKSALGDTSVFHANGSRYQRAPLDLLVRQYPIVAGHFTLAQIPDALFKDTFFFTFLRDPIDRALSHYYYYRNHPDVPVTDSRIAAARELDLDAFVEALPDRASPWSNWQTYLFSGAVDAEQPPADLLPAALWNLERLDFVGVHDEFEAGMQRLFAQRGWTYEPRRVNVTERRLRQEEIPTATLRRLQELNACDLALFAHAKELWNRTSPSPTVVLPQAPSSAGHPHARREHGSREIAFTKLNLRTFPRRPEGVAYEGDRVLLELHGVSQQSTDDLTLGMRITDAFGVEVYGVNTHLLGVPVKVTAGERFQTTFAFDMILAPGTYQITVAIHAGEDHLHKCYHWIDNAMTLECRRGEGPAFSGLVDLKAVAVLE
jgi:hypothetical protein